MGGKVRTAIANCDTCIKAQNDRIVELKRERGELGRRIPDEQRRRTRDAELKAQIDEAGRYIHDCTATYTTCDLYGGKFTPRSTTFSVPVRCVK